jgi:hypothetical protein
MNYTRQMPFNNFPGRLNRIFSKDVSMKKAKGVKVMASRTKLSLLTLMRSIISLIVLVLILTVLPAPVPRSEASTPPGGTISSLPSQQSVTWQGPVYAVAAVPDPAVCAPPDSLMACDHFTLTVNEAPSYWISNTGGAEISISWGSSDNDFDLYVYDMSGTQVGSSASGGTTSEKVFIQNANNVDGPYEVRVVPFMVTASNYSGTAGFVSQPGGPAPNPARSTGGLAFGPATVIDAQRTEGEPINHIDKAGNYWESGPWGFSTAQMFVHRSTDGGDQFNIVSPNGLRPNPTLAGGGDSDITTDDQGFAYFADLEGLLEIGCGVSNDNGNTWREQSDCATKPGGDDRQWLAVDNGATAAAVDNTVFLAYNTATFGSFIDSSPGSTGSTDLMGGFLYMNSSADPVNPVTSNAPCGQLRFDPVNRYLYYPCAAGDHVEIVKGHVNVAPAAGSRTGIVYSSVSAPASPGGMVGDIFPDVAIDKAGNVYAVWVDEIDHNVYYAYSTTQGNTWSSVRQINGNDTNSNVFPWAVAGNAGKLVVAWYSSSSHLDSDNMPSWYTNRQAATAFPWFGYVSEITNAASSSPAYAQQKFTEKPMHYGQICNGGLGCTTSMGDRTMADFFAVNLDLDGSMRLVYNDTTSQHHGAHLFEERQLAGPTAFGSMINKPVPKSPMSDPTGDAQSPHYFPITGPGANVPQFDFTKLQLSQPDDNTLRVQMTLNSLASLLPPTGKANSLWITRFQAPSLGEGNEESYRIFYVGAESVGGGPPTFFAGSGTSATPGTGIPPGNGCLTTTAQNCKVVEYPAPPVDGTAVMGSINGNVITIDVPIQTGFGAGRPIFGSTLFNVTALSAGRDNAMDVYADLDATRSFDFTLKKTVTPPGAGRKVTGGGAINGAITGDALFTLNVFENLKGKIDYRDNGSAVNFRSTKIDSVTFDSATSSVTIKGSGVNGNVTVEFTVVATDNGEPGTTDRFSISWTGYSNSGILIRGNIQIHKS